MHHTVGTRLLLPVMVQKSLLSYLLHQNGGQWPLLELGMFIEECPASGQSSSSANCPVLPYYAAFEMAEGNPVWSALPVIAWSSYGNCRLVAKAGSVIECESNQILNHCIMRILCLWSIVDDVMSKIGFPLRPLVADWVAFLPWSRWFVMAIRCDATINAESGSRIGKTWILPDISTWNPHLAN